MSSETYGAPETRERILEAARSVVSADGPDFKLADVASRAGVSRQALYLHFGDRTGVLIGLVQHMDRQLELGKSLEHVMAADSGEDLIRRTMSLHADFSAAIDSVALVLEGAQYQDEALGAAWRDRMRFRRGVHRALIDRLAEMGVLNRGWDADEAADLFYGMTMVSTWRELTREQGWGRADYIDRMTRLLVRALLTDDQVS